MNLVKLLPVYLQLALERDSLKKILSSIKYLSFDKLIKIIVGVFIHALLARHLGPERFGKISYILNYVAIFFPFVTFGLEEVLAKSFLENEMPPQDLVTSQIILRLLSGCIGYCFLVFFVYINNDFDSEYQLMIMLFGLVIFFRAFDVIEIFYQSRLLLRSVFWSRNLSYLSSSLMKWVGVILKFGNIFFLMTYFFEVLIWKFLNVFAYFRFNKFGKFNRIHSRKFVVYSFPMFLGSFIIMLDTKLGYLVLKEHNGDAGVGNFSIIMVLLDLWSFLPAAICTSLYPAMFNSKNGRSGNYQFRVQLIYDFLFWFGVIFSISVSFAAPLIVKILYGSRFPQLPQLLSMASWVSIWSFLNFIRVRLYALEDQIYSWVLSIGSSLMINLAFQIYLVPRMGPQGVFISMIISPVLSLIICSCFNKFIKKEFALILRSILVPIKLLRGTYRVIE